MKFSEMKYERPDLAAVKDELHALTERLKAARDYAEAREAFLAHEAAYSHGDAGDAGQRAAHDRHAR